MLKIFPLLYIILCSCASNVPAAAQDGMNFGIPNSSPGVFWPRGMGIEALSPDALYPNGPQFGISNTSGGFGLSGSGPISGVGLEQRVVSPLVRQEFSQRFSYTRILEEDFLQESRRGAALLNTSLAGSVLMPSGSSVVNYFSPPPVQIGSPQTFPNVDAILHDKPLSTDSVLSGGAR